MKEIERMTDREVEAEIMYRLPLLTADQKSFILSLLSDLAAGRAGIVFPPESTAGKAP